MSDQYKMAKALARREVIRFIASEHGGGMGLEAAERHFNEAMALKSFGMPIPTTEDIRRMEALMYSAMWNVIEDMRNVARQG